MTPRRVVLAGCLAGGLVLSPLTAFAAGPADAAAGTSEAATPAPTLGQDVRDALARGPVDLVVAYDAADVNAKVRTAQGGSPQEKQEALRSAAVSLGEIKGRSLKRMGAGVSVRSEYSNLPVNILRVESVDAAQAVVATAGVTAVSPARAYRVPAESGASPAAVEPAGTEWAKFEGQPAATAAGYDGRGIRVAVLDTGIDIATSAAIGAFGDCSGGWGLRNCRVDSFTDSGGSGKQSLHPHGTNVAGVVATVAPEAGIDVYNVFTSDLYAPDQVLLSALNQVQATSAQRGVRAVNLSLGDASHVLGTCSSPYSGVFSSLRSAGVAPVVAAGNAAYPNGAFADGMADPACVQGAVSVGAVYSANIGSRSYTMRPNSCTDSVTAPDKVACFSQTSPDLSLLAPGANVTAAGVTMSGTSQATPSVSGAIAALASAAPTASVDAIVGAMRSTGPTVVDPRTGRGTPRLDIAAAAAAIAPAPAHRTSVGADLASGESLDESTMLQSPNGEHQLQIGRIDTLEGLQLSSTFCDPLVLHRIGAGRPTNRLVMQADGNLVLYSNGAATWSSGTQDNPGARAVLQDDRNLVVYSRSGQPLWWTATVCTQGSTDDRQNHVVPRVLRSEQYVLSADRRFKLVTQPDGNVVLYGPKRALWSSGTAGNAGAYAVLQPDNNLVVYSAANKPLWWTGTPTASVHGWPSPTSKLVVQNDGNLVLYGVGDTGAVKSVLWTAGVSGA